MSLPSPAPRSTFADLDAPQADEPDYTDRPTAADYEWIAACNLDSFVPRKLEFADWLAEQARQHQIRGDDSHYGYAAWHAWLASRIDELAAQARFLGANDPATFDDRDEVMVDRNGSGRRGYRRPWVGASVAAIGGIADALGELPGSYPEIAATLRQHLRVLERAAGGAQ
jgi:hypothetical protein